MMNSKICVTKNFLLPLSMGLLAIMMISCGSTDSGDEKGRFEDGLLIEINEILGEDLLDVIVNELQVPIHRGENPPDIEAMFSMKAQKSAAFSEGVTVVMQPLLLLQSNVPNDSRSPGQQFPDLFIRFTNQNMENYTIDYEDFNSTGNYFQGEGYFIVGDGNKFSIFGVSESEQQTGTVVSMDVFSGIITEKGISAPHSAFIMVDNDGVKGFLPNGTGRSVEDGDGLSEITTWPGPEKRLTNEMTAQNKLPDKWRMIERN